MEEKIDRALELMLDTLDDMYEVLDALTTSVDLLLRRELDEGVRQTRPVDWLDGLEIDNRRDS